MSQAIIDFCEGLKTTLLALEDRLGKAKSALEAGASQANIEAKKHVDEAAEHLAAFKTRAEKMAQAIRAELPQQTAVASEKLKEFGQEAQVALRHAAVFLAETAARGAEGTAGALQAGAKSAHRVAETLRHDTALTAIESGKSTPPG
jgi:hypothetical protein